MGGMVYQLNGGRAGTCVATRGTCTRFAIVTTVLAPLHR
jgi:hypothetical protein